MTNTKQNSEALFILSKKDKFAVTLGSCFLMLYIAAHASSIAISQSFILTKLNGMNFFSLSAILLTLGTAIMTPIGGQLGDILGKRKLIVYASVVAFLSSIGIAYGTSVSIYLISMLINSMAKGAFIASPYILMNIINEKKDIPKAMGFLASSIAAGAFLGALISGIFNDLGKTELGLFLTGFYVIIGGFLIFIGLKNEKPNKEISLDLKGIVLLTLFISSFVLTLNFGPDLGWTDTKIIAGFIILILSGILFVRHEKNIESANGSPIISISLFKNQNYRLLLLIGLIAYFYQSIISNYGTLASLKILGQSATKTATLTLPRMVLTLLLPSITGVWVGKKTGNYWKAMALATGLVVISFIPLAFLKESTPISTLFICFTITGVAESFRAVSITPAAQATLSPDNLSTGTSLVNFINTLSAVLASTLSGLLFNLNENNILLGIRSIFILTIIVSFIGFVIVITKVRKFYQ